MNVLVGDGEWEDEEEEALRGEGEKDVVLGVRTGLPSAEGNDEGGVLADGSGEDGLE